MRRITAEALARAWYLEDMMAGMEAHFLWWRRKGRFWFFERLPMRKWETGPVGVRILKYFCKGKLLYKSERVRDNQVPGRRKYARLPYVGWLLVMKYKRGPNFLQDLDRMNCDQHPKTRPLTTTHEHSMTQKVTQVPGTTKYHRLP
jgi:hypothetical protein